MLSCENFMDCSFISSRTDTFLHIVRISASAASITEGGGTGTSSRDYLLVRVVL